MTTLCGMFRLAPKFRFGVAHQLTKLAAVSSMRCMSGLSIQFEESKDRLGKLKDDPGNEAKLKIYALFKQATIGTVNTKRPGMMDFVGRAKWDAWNALGEMSQEEAQKAYIDYVNSLVAEEEEQAESQTASVQKYETIDVTVQDGLCIIKLNRPKKKNAITVQMYNEWSSALKEADEDPGIVITAVTGAGDYYCSGNDLSNFMNIPPEGMKQMAIDSGKLLNRFVSSFIDFKKPLIAVVNGPAVGVSVTILGLYDAVYATDKATFHTPFSALGQSPEGCSSYTFPRTMGTSKSTEMLLFNKKITAHEAEKVGFISEVFPDSSFQQEVWPRLYTLAKLPRDSLIYSKALTRAMEKDVLHKVNDAECDRLVERWLSDDCAKAIMAFFSRRK